MINDQNDRDTLITKYLYFYTTTEYLFQVSHEMEVCDIVNEGKNIIQELYRNNQEKFEVYIFYSCIIKGKRNRWIKRRKLYYQGIKNLFPSDSEIDKYFREIFLEEQGD